MATKQELDALFEKYYSLPIVANILTTLEENLAPKLTFHSAKHTNKVLREALAFALEDNLSAEETELLAIAAAYHDAGFLETSIDNESIGARLAMEAMQEAGTYSGEQIQCVETMILDTRLVHTKLGPRQMPSSDLSCYLLDADLSNLGRDDFLARVEDLRNELEVEREVFYFETRKLLENHEWLTPAAKKIRYEGQKRNIARLDQEIAKFDTVPKEVEEEAEGLSLERLLFLGKLPLLLNSSLHTKKIANLALEHLNSMIDAEAATLFLLDESSNELTFWALEGEQTAHLEGKKMSASQGVVGWVIQKQESVQIDDVKNDPRFFSVIDTEGSFNTRNLICVPLIVRGQRPLGAIQVLNKKSADKFRDGDYIFVKQFAHQMALALENARLYESLSQKTQQLAALDRRKKEMITVIGHEFKTPLNVIRSSADLLSSGLLKDEAAQKKMADTLEKGVMRLTKLVSEIRDVSGVSEEKVPLKMTDIVVRDILDKVSNQFAEPVEKRNLSLKIDIADNVSNMKGDFALIMVVIRNLVSNAIRFTDDGGYITLAATKSSGLVEIAVQDTGIGIEEAEIPLIFEKFYEVTDVMEHSSGQFEFKSGGLGIGLSTANSILQQHGSSIDVESEFGKGSVFKFRLSEA